ncbi:MAG: HD domain-containing protein [Patescibacteria group bacterium]|nr:HD domain-containing protein [Patescibacteria group bacterium]MDD4304155.1 HD domain-containing protein [Patescibacteria group bacterium]MDD4695186.1 HD domain-containing protein [Patescibacteria group bacterium]
MKEAENLYNNTNSAESLNLNDEYYFKLPEMKNNSQMKNDNENGTEKQKYSQVIEMREYLYAQDIEEETDQELKEKKEGNLAVLENHNKTVLDYALLIMEQIPNLSKKEKVSATTATILHDSGKLISDLKTHHTAGIQRAEEILKKIEGTTIDGIKINDQFIETVKSAIERHMNHPFLVKYINSGKRYPDPITIEDKIVFDADMLANIGFKNVGFRLNTEKFMNEDTKKSLEENTSILEQSFINVLEGEDGAKRLIDVLLLEESKDTAIDLIKTIDKIFEDLKNEKVFYEIQNIFSENGIFNIETIKNKGGLNLLKDVINEKIKKSGIKFEINPKIIAYIQI